MPGNTTYEFTCEQGHDPIVFTVTAPSVEQATRAFAAMEDVQSHLAETHTDLTELQTTELGQLMRSMIRPVPTV